MRLVELRVRAFRRLRDLTLDLDHDRLLVIGANEAGKSTAVDALVAGLYGLAPAKRGGGHAAALRAVQPWTGEPAALALRVEMDDGRHLELDWDFSAEATRVVDHGRGQEITPDFASGTHGWLDAGERLAGLPAGVFRQVTCVAEGELAAITDEADLRRAILRLTDAGVDVLVEQAVARLNEAARQSTAPRVNSATRRVELTRELQSGEDALEAARREREQLEHEAREIRDTEAQLAVVRQDQVRILAGEEAREGERLRLRSAIDRAEGRLAEAELRLGVTATGGQQALPWSDEEVEAARQHLVTPPPPRPGLSRATVAGWAVATSGAGLLVVGTLGKVLPMSGAAVLVIAAGVYLLTRGWRTLEPRVIQVGRHVFPDRQTLMVALDEERARRDHAGQQAAVNDLRGRLDQLLELSRQTDEELESRVTEADALQSRLELQLERRRGSYERGSRMVPEVAPLEEAVADLRERLRRLEEFGAAAARGAATLHQSAEETRRNYAPKLQGYLSRDLARITGGRYREAVVGEDFEVLLRVPETGSVVDTRQLSRGTQQQIYLLLRLGLLEALGAANERLPLLLDDALALADDRRRPELLKVLEGEARQVIYFTAGDIASSVFDQRWHRLRLPAPASEPAHRGTGELPRAAVDGPV